MKVGVLAGLVLFGAIVTSCAGATTSTPGPQGVVAAPSVAVASAAPTVDPAIVAAGTAYKAAADAYNGAAQKLLLAYGNVHWLAKAQAHYKAMARAEQAFAAAIRKATFPAVLRPHVKLLLDTTEAVAALDLKASKLKALGKIESLERDIFVADRHSSAAADLVRRDFRVLGINL